VLFLQKDRKKLRGISYSLAEDANTAPDITVFAEHITGTGIKSMSFSQDPDYILWAIRDDGVMLSLTHLREQQVTAWARHTTVGAFESVSCIPESTGSTPYVIAVRSVNGASRRYVEYLDYTGVAQTDCASYGQDLVTKHSVWNNLGFLEGQTVSVVADGMAHPNVIVTGGAVTLLYAANSIQVGLPYTTTLEFLRPELQLPDGTSQGRPVSISEMTLRFQDTVGCRVNGYEIPFRSFGQNLDTPIAAYTGDKQVKVLGWGSTNLMKIEQVRPMPFTLLGVAYVATISDTDQ
jgi:hypothetical protein